ncbi:ATP-binding protein [Mucilaginibacter paludis]|uniref:histidine kinase n=1 Tax=Mucilaginibacter paludis DSM 18603 TaxID=714943 RepID=H1Y3R6_9SPHI|nr:ATP-binding protein [Mucilaginibacter paludis]EHQ30328.1 histidine kinase [Mucilaginibacter paludis DSM 18603]
MIKVTTSWLQTIDLLQDVPVVQLQWLIDNSKHHIIKDGDFLFKTDSPIDATHFVVSGRIKLFLVTNNETRQITTLEPKAIAGYLPYSRGKIAVAYAEANGDVQLMSLPIEKSKELITNYFELTQSLVHVMTTRVRDFTALQQQNEKMMALGKLSAGLAHELNNPASAVVRGSASLKQHLQLIPDRFKDVISIRMSPEEVDKVNDLMFAVLNKTDKPVLTMMQRSQQEDDMVDWMERYDVKCSTDIAENLVDYGFKLADLDAFKDHIPESYISPVFNWINSNLVIEKMVGDIEDASRRIGKLVDSVKTFTHMDQGSDKQFADIHNGIRNTLTMLQYKIRKGNIDLIENFDLELPMVKAMIGELNQVWTNLIDNAIDAMEVNGKGILEIRTERDGAFVQVSIIDNGPGVPEQIRTRIFEPFFTTKEIGKGTGLGLDVVMQIVKQHHGEIKVKSTPGNTAFVVCFPING